MRTRIITAIVALALFIPILVFGGVWGVSATFAVIAAFSIFEMSACCGLQKLFVLSVPAIALSAFCVMLPAASEMLGIPDITKAFAVLSVLVFLYFIFISVLCHSKCDAEKLFMFFSMLFYITAGFASMGLMMRRNGLWAIILVLAVSWATDTFAYFTGMAFGKRKLCPNISPKKTVAGAVGGTLFGTLAGGIVLFCFDAPVWWTAVCLPLSVISQFGDLAASVIKRQFGVKDYGNIFPGHGGVLDRFDSILPVAIATTVFLTFMA